MNQSCLNLIRVAFISTTCKNALLDIAYGYGVAGIHNIRGLDNCVNNQDWICAADVATRTYASRKPGIQIRQWFLQAAGNQ